MPGISYRVGLVLWFHFTKINSVDSDLNNKINCLNYSDTSQHQTTRTLILPRAL